MAYGFGPTLLPQVGKMFRQDNNEGDGGALYFAPDTSVQGDGSSDWTDANMPYGGYRVVNSWVPSCWQTSDGACDDGLAELAPDAQGVYPGQRVGAYPLMWNYSPAVGAETYMVGYPEQGNDDSGGTCSAGFCLPANGYGDRQYFCQDSFDGQYSTSANDPSGAWLIGTGYYHRVPGCPMTGGASGGPDFIQGTNGTWYINGVNNIGTQSQTTGFGVEMDFNWWGAQFGSFFCGILPNQCS